jgi:hypothetical protein
VRAKALQIARRKTGDERLPYLVGEMENAFASASLAVDDLIRNAETAMPGPETTNRAVVARTLAGQAAIRTGRARDGGRRRCLLLPPHRPRTRLSRHQGARFHPLQEKAQLRYTGLLRSGWISTAKAFGLTFGSPAPDPAGEERPLGPSGR